jgi:hypothetical protein
MRMFKWIGFIFAGGLGGCAIHPIPDDVSPYTTQQIVRFGRCEMRDEVIEYINYNYINRMYGTSFTGPQIAKLIKPLHDKKHLTEDESHLLRLGKVGVVYSFDFNITENNKAGADAGFRLPGLTSVLDAGATAGLDLTRQGQRVFGTEDTWEELMSRPTLCPPPELPQGLPGNFIYPLTGSIGVRPVVRTFIDIDEQGGAKDHFVDTLTFTTQANAGANATLKVDPVPNQFRLVSATAAASASRLDVHKLTLSLAFPLEDPPPQGGISGVVRTKGDLNAPFQRPPIWRARYNLCVQDARTREASFKLLRLTDPLVYCIAYADEFAPKYGPSSHPALEVTVTQAPAQSGKADGSGGSTPRRAPRATVRPNLRPFVLQ